MNRRKFVRLIGVTAIWPLTARAQNATLPTIGVLASTRLTDGQIAAFHDGLGETGYVEGRDVSLLFHSAEGNFDRLPGLAADLVNRQVAVIVAMASPLPARAAKAATSTIPIIFAYAGDPVEDNLVTNFNRPEGNVTGATFIGATLSSKRLELLNEIVPGLTDVAILVNPKGGLAEGQVRETEAAVRTTGQRLHVVNAGNSNEIDAAFADIARLNAKGLLVSADAALSNPFVDQIVALAARHRLPAMYANLTFGNAGGLITYGVDARSTWRQAGIYTGRILKGEKPGNLPVVQPTKFDLIVNLKTARALGLTISEAFLVRADKVIE